MRKSILLACHDDPISGGYFGFERTYRKIRERYFWPHMYTQIKDWTDSCKPCNKRKRHYGFKPAPITPILVGLPFDRVAFDLVGPFPCTAFGNKYILIFQDYKTKWCEGCPLKTIDSKQIAHALFDLNICQFGSPTTILSDRGSNFLSGLMYEIYRIRNITKLNTTAYRPQTDGMVESLNGTLIQALSKYTAKNQGNWDQFVNFSPFTLIWQNRTITYRRDTPSTLKTKRNGNQILKR